MALVVYDRVQETTTTSGTGSVTLGGAVAGFQSFAVIGNGNTTFYCIVNGVQWEVGVGTYSTTGPTLARTTVLSNSDGNTTPINLSGGSVVFVTYPSEKSVNLDASGNVTALGTITSGVWNGTTIPVAYGGTGVTASSGANSVVLRDAFQNITTNNINLGYQAIATSAGTTIFTASSPYYTQFTGTSNQTLQLPNATTMPVGATFIVDNDSTGVITVKDGAGTSFESIISGGIHNFVLINNGTIAGTWTRYSLVPSEVDWGTNSLQLNSTVISGGYWRGNTVETGYGGTGLTGFGGANAALYSTSSLALTAGTLPVPAGGTGQTAFSSGYIPYGNSSAALQSSNLLQFNGSYLQVGGGSILGGTTNPIAAFSQSANNYVQTYTYNPNGGTSSSSDFVAYTDNSTDAHGWADIGYTSSTYSDASYSVTGPNEAYVLGSAPSGAGKTGNLVYATDSTGTANSHQWYVGGFNQAKGAWKMQLTSTGLQLANALGAAYGGTGATTLTGYVYGNGTGAMTASTTIPGSALSGTVAIANGGTGQTTASAAFNGLSPITTAGDLILGTGVNTAGRLGIGANGTVLTSDGTTASWSTAYAGTVTSVSESFTGGLLSVSGSPITTSGTFSWSVAGTSGGIPYFSSASTWASSGALTANGIVYGGGAGAAPSSTAAGTTGQVLIATTGGAPSWGSIPSTAAVTSFSAGTTGFTPSTGTTGAVTLSGTLNVANGGTGSSSLAANNVLLGNGTSALQVVAPGTSGNVLTSNGTTWVSQAPAGAISWQAVQAANFSATAGNGYPVNTTSGVITVTLPASPSAGQMISLVDYAGTFSTNPLKINPNGNKIIGLTSIRTLITQREAVNLVYIDSTQGWLPYSYASNTVFAQIAYLVVAGGGGGGGYDRGSGGGAGGLLSNSSYMVTPGSVYTVTVGGGGAGGSSGGNGGQGSNSVFGSFTALGGGLGVCGSIANQTGVSGGSGSGGSYNGNKAGGAGTSGQGNSGGTGSTNNTTYGSAGGGGGAGAAGSNGTTSNGGNGGTGVLSSISGASVYYAGGGGGATDSRYTQGTGGNGGGGGSGSAANGTAGTANTGGGGGGGGNTSGNVGGAGGSGVVILSIPTAYYTGTYTGTPTITTNSGNTILTFTSSGSYTA